jgi:chorismate mutase/prephenate dehydratase
MPNARIRALRKKIDAIDRELTALLNRRAQLSHAVGRIKRELGLPLFIHTREREIAHNVRRANRGPLSNRALNHVFDELLRLTRVTVRKALRLERPRRTGQGHGRSRGKHK